MSAAEPLRRIARPDPAEVPDDVAAFLRWLGGPTWIEVPGHDSTRLRIASTLLHGNEPSGVRAVHAYLRSERRPAVDTAFYVAAVDAALGPPLFRHRMLPGRRDLNRCFLPPFDGVDGARARAFLDALTAQPVEALVDLHNNTGHNPAYGVARGLGPALLNITSLFGDFYVHSDILLGTLVDCAGELVPAVTVECGRAGDPAADAAALAGLERFLSLDSLELDAPPPAHLVVLSRPVRVRLRPETRFGYATTPQPGADLTLKPDLDRHNFETLPAGTCVGWVRDGAAWPLDARGAEDRDVSGEMFAIRGGCLETRVSMVPVMMTTDPVAARQDCLFYAMEAVLTGPS